MQIIHILPNQLPIQRLALTLPSLIQRQQHRSPELIRLQLGLHAFLQTVDVPRVAETLLDRADLRVASAH